MSSQLLWTLALETGTFWPTCQSHLRFPLSRASLASQRGVLFYAFSSMFRREMLFLLLYPLLMTLRSPGLCGQHNRYGHLHRWLICTNSPLTVWNSKEYLLRQESLDPSSDQTAVNTTTGLSVSCHNPHTFTHKRGPGNFTYFHLKSVLSTLKLSCELPVGGDQLPSSHKHLIPHTEKGPGSMVSRRLETRLKMFSHCPHVHFQAEREHLMASITSGLTVICV